MMCCSTEEVIRNEEENKPDAPVVYTYPDAQLAEDPNTHKSASEITRLEVP